MIFDLSKSDARLYSLTCVMLPQINSSVGYADLRGFPLMVRNAERGGRADALRKSI